MKFGRLRVKVCREICLTLSYGLSYFKYQESVG
jgi:hypothetical protein